jgi:PAS domain S-box-containing protein
MEDADATDDGSRLQLLSRDELEARVTERTADLESLMDTMVDVLVRLDAEGRITMANRAPYDVLGYEEGTVVGKPVDVVFASPDDNEQLSDTLTRGELTERRLTDGQVKHVEVSFETAEGEAIPMSLSASVMDGADGADPDIVCVAKDISERTEAEGTAAFLHSLLRHDLGNKLQVTQGSLDLVAEDAPAELQDFIDDALAGVDEAIELIENVRTLTQVESETEPLPVDCSAAVRESVRRHEDLRTQAGFDVEFDVDDDLRVLGSPLCKELFANPVENALTHSAGSLVRVSASRDGDVVMSWWRTTAWASPTMSRTPSSRRA